MSQYNYIGMGVSDPTKLITTDQIDKMTGEEALSDAQQRSMNIVLALKSLESTRVSLVNLDPAVSAKLTTLANDLSGLRNRMNTYYKNLPDQDSIFKMTPGEWAMALTALPPLVIFKQIWGEDPINKNGRLMLRQILLFQKELQGYCARFSKITGKSVTGCAPLPDPKPRPDVKPEDRFLDFLWGTVKVGGVVLGGWLLYQYLEKQTRYPANKLPRYAGGKRRRKTSRRSR